MDKVILIGGISVEVLLTTALILTIKAKRMVNATSARLEAMINK